LLDKNCVELSLRHQCKLLGISRSGIYYNPPGEALNDDKLSLLRVVDEIYTRHPSFGTRQMASYMRTQGYAVEREQIRWVYKRLGLRSLAPGPHTSRPNPEHVIYPYLLRGVAITRVNQVWSTDITYIRLQRGFVYLMAIIDWYSRYVLDWQLSTSLAADFCIETLERVLAQSKCEIFNTDQGAQFTSKEFTGLLNAQGIRISMDGKGRALDNVFVERPHQGLRNDRIPALVYAGKQ